MQVDPFGEGESDIKSMPAVMCNSQNYGIVTILVIDYFVCRPIDRLELDIIRESGRCLGWRDEDVAM